MKWLRMRARRYLARRGTQRGDLWVGNYFIRLSDADRLRAGEKIPAGELTLYGYKDLGDDPSGRVNRGEPDALVACDLVVARTW